ncbi:hypothetical protein ACN28G_29720 [Micromonospora sp. WMMA1923]|uniref:hypothetical protein n=1 Tax=Micromonospora sp. WMMA1923 TaxID=3404125 RepID=UPI003B943606
MSAVHNRSESVQDQAPAERSAVFRRLESASPEVRLALRSHPALIAMTLLLSLVDDVRKWLSIRRIIIDIFGSHDDIPGLTSSLEENISTASRIARFMVYASDSEFEQARPVATTLARTIGDMLRFGPSLESRLARTFGIPGRSSLSPLRDSVRELEQDLVRNADLAHSLAVSLRGGSALALARTASHDLDLEPALAADLYLAVALAFDIAVDVKQGFANALAQSFDQLRSDFAGADLRNFSLLSSVNLGGVRWSSTTKWPPEWADYLRLNSVLIGPDLFEVQSGNADMASDAGLIRH